MTKIPIELRRRRDLRRVAIGALVLWAIIGTVGTVSLAIQRGKNTTALHEAAAAAMTSSTALRAVEAQQARQHTQLVEGCVRLNIQRATANSVYAAEYKIDELFFTAVQNVPPPPNATAEQRRLTREFLAAEQSALGVIVWTPLTDCVRAVASKGVRYKAPRPVAFSRRPPPPSALSVDNATLLAPVGSTP